MAIIQVRVDDELKDRATEVANELGLDLPTAIRLFLRQMVAERALPFRPKIDPVRRSEDRRHVATGDLSS